MYKNPLDYEGILLLTDNRLTIYTQSMEDSKNVYTN